MLRLPLLLAVFSLGLLAQNGEWPGPKPDGTTLLPNGWSLRPHGRQIPLRSDYPLRMQWHPEGRWLAVQHAGFREHEIVILDSRNERVVARAPLGKTWSGMCFSRDGRRLFASGGVDDRIRVFDFDARKGSLEAAATWSVGTDGVLDLPSGLCATNSGKLWVLLQRSHRAQLLDSDGALLTDIALGAEAYPFDCLLTPNEEILWISLWGRGAVRGIDPKTGRTRFDITTGQHPSELLLGPEGQRLFVSNANENTVTAIDVAKGRAEETLCSSLHPDLPPGSTPNALALSKEGSLLLVANADNNNCAVIDVRKRSHSKSLGFIPLGWYPTSIRFSTDGKRVFVANAKGSLGSRRNPGGPNPGRSPTNLAEYTGSMFAGSLSVFEFPTPEQLRKLSTRAYACSPLKADPAALRVATERPKDSPIPKTAGGETPLRYCVYIIKENRTYDQVLGDDPRGNGDPSLCLFPEKVTPNHHALAREFVLLDNFYVESEVSADGHEWTMGGYASDFVERSWPVSYGGKGSARQGDGSQRELGYPAEGNFPIAFPKNRYLFDRAAAAGISYRSYGEFIRNGKTPRDPGTAKMQVLEGHFDPGYRGYDLNYPDVSRAKRFLQELKGFEAKGVFPRLVVIRLPNDHTSGARIGKPTPRAYVADNDLGLGRVIEGLSRSMFWKNMTVFVVEDDAQNGPDHVDAHRTIAFLAGPYVKRGAVVSTLYSTCSMLRTMEQILGLEPMSQFDAAARPLYDCFTAKPDFRPFVCRPASWDLEEKNASNAWGAKRSESFDLSREDAADDLALNEVIWKSVKGAASSMPAPRRAAFVRIPDEEE